MRRGLSPFCQELVNSGSQNSFLKQTNLIGQHPVINLIESRPN
jgi:hypothetical protein